MVKNYTPFQVTWQFRTRPLDESSPWSDWTSFGTTSSILYITWGGPTQTYGDLRRTLVSNACKIGGAESESATILNVWATFKTLDVSTWDGQPLYYYEPGTTGPQNGKSVPELLDTKRGQCGAWALLLSSCLDVHGIVDKQVMQVDVNHVVSQDFAFLVWSWQALAATGANPYWYVLDFPQTIPSEMFPPTVGVFGDLYSDDEIPGQNSSPHCPSQKIFQKHYILRTKPGLYYVYYDASYGLSYSSPKNMQQKAIYGFCNNSMAARINWAGTGLVFSNWP